jgi:quercetin dioxygenase-like cupin family protein
MVEPGDCFEHPLTGERVTVIEHSAQLLVLEDVWPRPGRRAPEHVHPGMEERFTVISGVARIRVGGRERELAAGDSFAVAPGTPHIAWNPTEGEVRLRLEFRPALRWAEFVRRMFAAPEPAAVRALMAEFPDEIAAAAN